MAMDLQGYASRRAGDGEQPSRVLDGDLDANEIERQPEKARQYFREMGISEDEIDGEMGEYLAELRK